MPVTNERKTDETHCRSLGHSLNLYCMPGVVRFWYLATRMTWYTEHRLEWIAECLRVYGFINRAHLARKFGISIPQAAIDLRAFKEAYPGMMQYDNRQRVYVAADQPKRVD